MIDDDILLEIDELFGSSVPTDEELLAKPYQAIYSYATYYPGMVRLFVPNSPRLVFRPEVESYGEPKKRVKGDKGGISEEDLERSVRQSRKTLRDLLLRNKFDWFVTLTIAEDRHDAEKSVTKVLTWLKNQRQRNGAFRYVMVTERHKDGARHFHAVFGDYPGKMVRAINPKTGKPLRQHGRQIYNLVEYRSGFSTAKCIGGKLEDRQKVSSYIAKYITKDMVAEFGKKRYWRSRGLQQSVKERNPIWYAASPTALNIKPDRVYEMEYGKILTYYHPEEKDFPAYVKLLLTSEDS